jgi:predicted nucleic-acid-binding Zn-ribbon protein
MNIVAILMVIIMCIIILSLPIYIFYIEPRDFNNGYCKHCGTKLRHFDIDSSSARGYTCDNCGYTTWINYFADKNFK